MKACTIASVLLAILLAIFVDASRVRGETTVVSSDVQRKNNLVSQLLRVASISKSGETFAFTRAKPGWVFISARCKGRGGAKIVLDAATRGEVVIAHTADPANRDEAVRYVTQGEHQLLVQSDGDLVVEELVVRAIPELMHCGLGFDPAIKSYGRYDIEFLKRDILPNVTTLVVPHNIELPSEVVDGWHRQGKKFVAEVGIHGQAKSADDHFNFWTGFYDKAPFLDGILINEFIVNTPSNPQATISPGAAKSGIDRRICLPAKPRLRGSIQKDARR